MKVPALNVGPVSWLCWAVVFVLLTVAFNGQRPLAEPDEGRYAEASREMLIDGDWLIPRLQGQPHLTKPPVTYWLTALGMKLWGVNETGARFFLSLAFLGTILAVMDLARVWGWSRWEALAAAFVFATALLPYLAGHILTTDMFLCSFTTLGTLAAWRVWSGEGSEVAWRWIFWLTFALAFLTKGPPGWLMLLVIAVFRLLRRPVRRFGRVWSPWAFGVFLGVAGSWFVALVLRRGELVHYFLVDEFYERIFTAEHQREAPFWIYVPTIALGVAPWIFLWPDLVRRTWRNLAGRRLAELPDAQVFSLLWVALPLLTFTLARSRMYLYVLPLMVPIAIWGGRSLVRWWPGWRAMGPGGRAVVILLGGVWSVFLVGVKIYPDHAPKARSNRNLARQIERVGSDRIGTLYSTEDPLHSISFYTGLQVREKDIDEDEVIAFLRAHRRQGKRISILLETEDKDALDGRYRVLAQDAEWTVIALPEPP